MSGFRAVVRSLGARVVPGRSCFLGLVAVVGSLASAAPTRAEDFLQWIAHFDPTAPHPVNDTSETVQEQSAPPQAPLLPTGRLLFERQYPNGVFQYWLDGGNGIWYVKYGNPNNLAADAYLQVARNPTFVMLRHKETNEHVVMFHDGNMWSTLNPPPGQSWRHFAQAKIFRLGW